MGLQCLNLATLASCGFTQLDSVTLPPISGTAGSISTDGIPAANGNYYAFDSNGNMLFQPHHVVLVRVDQRRDGQIANTAASYLGSILTSGQYVYQTYVNSDGEGTLYMSCLDTATIGVPGLPDQRRDPGKRHPRLPRTSIVADRDAPGRLRRQQREVLLADGHPRPTPIPPTSGSDLHRGTTGFGSGAIVGSRF